MNPGSWARGGAHRARTVERLKTPRGRSRRAPVAIARGRGGVPPRARASARHALRSAPTWPSHVRGPKDGVHFMVRLRRPTDEELRLSSARHLEPPFADPACLLALYGSRPSRSAPARCTSSTASPDAPRHSPRGTRGEPDSPPRCAAALVAVALCSVFSRLRRPGSEEPHSAGAPKERSDPRPSHEAPGVERAADSDGSMRG